MKKIEELQIGQVKMVRSNNGRDVDLLELLFSPKTKASFAFNKENNCIDFIISDTDIKYQELNCQLDLETLNNLIRSLHDIRERIN